MSSMPRESVSIYVWYVYPNKLYVTIYDSDISECAC